ncbi:MAG TPA: 30S ribosome-binding factor RbfA [Blastocatellia bacterium]|jgi:ribosome-binding factor A|nr:30S ribosome-binding factor RbfA [Blastocatellia bacterium]
MSGRRPERLAEQIKEEVSLIVAGEVEDPRIGFVTVTDAKITPDLRHAKIYVSVMGTEEEVKESLKALNRASRFIRHQLGAVLRIRRVPELHFVFDATLRTAARIEELLSEEVEKAREREQRPPEEVSSSAASEDREQS